MRRTVLALAAVIVLSGCQQPAGGPEAEPAAADAPAPVMPADAPPQEELAVEPSSGQAGDGATCRDAVGEAASARLVQRCIAVSPATHPPCNALNPCAQIQGEIDRSCEMFPAGEKPAECEA